MLPALAALLVFVATSILAALALLLPAHRGLDTPTAGAALAVGLVAALGAGWHTRRRERLSLPGRRRLSPWGWIMLTVFALFALRSFCFLVYFDGDKVVIGSPNNLGDLSMHLQEIRYFADGAPWWPEHPEAAGQSLRYYPGVNLFQALLHRLGADDFRTLVWMGLVGSAATALALYRWGGSFTLAGFLFSGGLAGWQFFGGGFQDYQADLGWKSLPLAVFVTQRPFLYALPAGLLLMIHWRRKFFTDLPPAPKPAATATDSPVLPPPPSPLPLAAGPGLLPFWVELLLYATLPVLHLFAFVFLSVLLGWWFFVYFGRPALRWHLLLLVGLALLPAAYQVSLMTGTWTGGHFHPTGANLVHLEWGWMAHGRPFWSFLWFWPLNFGFFLFLAPALWLQLTGRSLLDWWRVNLDGYLPAPRSRENDAAVAFVVPAGLLFLVALNVMFARWDWDNTKLMLWCYLAFLPFLWRLWIRPLTLPLRAPLCVLLFFSGAVSLLGGLGPSHLGYKLIERKELDGALHVVTALPTRYRYASAPDYNHPLVYAGRKLAMGYDGHLYSQGLDYQSLLRDLNTLMDGSPGWDQIPKKLGVRYIFWGPREAKRWPNSTRPWENQPPVAMGAWGAVYDVGP